MLTPLKWGAIVGSNARGVDSAHDEAGSPSSPMRGGCHLLPLSLKGTQEILCRKQVNRLGILPTNIDLAAEVEQCLGEEKA